MARPITVGRSNARRNQIRPPIRIVLAWVVCVAGVASANGQERDRCDPADRYLTETLGMITRVDPDTLDDWRTHQRLPACRITAAGVRRSSLRVAARMFYDELRAAGWTRTPNPRDSPNESSLRMRHGQVDCLFNVYQGILLGTEAEIAVTNAVAKQPGEEFYNVLVICVPALPAGGADRTSDEEMGAATPSPA